MDKTPKPEESEAKQTLAQEANGLAKHPVSAPAVPAEMLRQLTKDLAVLHRRRLAKPKVAATSAPALPKTDEASDQAPATDTAEPVSTDASKPETVAKDDLDDGMSDPDTDQAVDEIVSEEGDELLSAEDAQVSKETDKPNGFWQKIKNFFYAWWHNKWARWATVAGLLVIVIVVAAIPTARYKVLNAVGVRSSLSVVALDGTTQLPLKNVTISVAGKQTTTDINGVAKISGLKLGPETLTVQRIAFATVTQHVVVGWGNNQLGNVSLKAVGVQYTINTTDFLSGKPLQNVEATSNGVEALSDKTGKTILTVDNQNAQTVPVAIILNGYRTEQLNLPAANTLTTAVQLVTARKDVSISKPSGKYDLYKIDADGKNKQMLLAGTGNENENISLVVGPSGNEAALVSTRDNIRDNDGYLLTTLTLVNIGDGTTVTLDHAQQVQVVDWIDNRLIYDETAAGASAANSQRNRLLSYDYTTSSRIQLATANQFSGVLTANGTVYYGTAATDPLAPPIFTKIRPDGTNRQTIYSQEVWSIFRTDYNTLALQTPNGWLNYSIQNNQLAKAEAPASFVGRVYSDSADGQQSLWVDSRDGQGVLLSYSLTAAKDTALQTQAGLTYPVRWLTGDSIVYSVVTKTETADYVVSIYGGKPHKITDVTHVSGITQGT